MRWAIVVLMLLAGVGAVPEVAAEIEGLQLQVDGLSCPFCAIGLDKNLKQRAGLEGIEVHLKQGITEAKLPEGEGIDVGKIRRAIKEAGFTLRGIKLAVIGRVIRDDGHLAIESRTDGTRLLLFDPAHQEGGSEDVLDPGVLHQLERSEAARGLVRISGAVHEHAGMPAGLMVETFEALVE